MPIIMNNYSPYDMFSNITTWRADGIYGPTDLPKGEWSQRRDNFLQSNRSIIESTTGSGLPLRDMANYYLGIYDDVAATNIGESIGAWERVKTITEGSGVIYGWDTETFGDIKNAQAVLDGKAGITELGISKNVFQDGSLTHTDDYSILIKMNSNQVDYVQKAIGILKTKGWDELDEFQQVTLNRVSKYRSALADTAVIDYMDNVSFTTVSNLSSEMGRDVGAVETGLKFLKRNGSDISAVLPKYIEALSKGISDGAGLMGANTSGFDNPVLLAMSVNADTVKSINTNTADLTMGHRHIASVHNMSTNQLNQTVKGGKMYRHTTDSNTVSAMNESLGYEEFDAHVAGYDARKTVTIGTTKKYLNDKSFIDNVIESHARHTEPVTISDDSVIFVNNGYLDKNSLDQVRIGSDTTQNYSITNTYWTLDEEKSGMRTWTPEGANSPQEAFVLSFKSAADEDDVEFTKAFKNEDEAARWLGYNTTILGRDEITQEQINTQARYKMLDYGRREYDRFFDSNSVVSAGLKDEGGYESLVKHLNAYDAVSAALTKEGIEDHAEFLYTKQGADFIKPILEKNGISYDSQQRAFIGMYGKLRDESDVLRHIAKFAEGKGHNNLTRTVITQDMHNTAISQMESLPQVRKVPYDTFTLSDVYSIDILGSDGNYHTVRGNTPTKLASGIRYLYESSNKSTASSLYNMSIGVDDLLDRGLIDNETHSILTRQLKSSPSLFDASKEVAYALDGIFQPFRNNSAITVYEQVMTGTNTELEDVIQQRIMSKNINGPASLGLQRMQGTNITTTNGDVITLNQVFSGSNLDQQLDATGSLSANKNLAFASNLTLREEDLVHLGQQLGYSNSQLELVSQMFSGGKKDTYALNAYKDQGLVSALITPIQQGNSGYIVMTNQQHATRVYNLLTQVADRDLSYSEMQDLLKGHASFFELKAIHKQKVGDMPSDMREVFQSNDLNVAYVNQGKNSIKYTHAGLDFYLDDGVLKGGLKEAGSEVISTYRKNAPKAIAAALSGDFDRATRYFREGVNAVLKDDSGSASYQGILDTDGGKIRGMNFNPSDIIHGGYFEYGEGIDLVTRQALMVGNMVDNPLANVLTIFNESLPEQIITREELVKNPMSGYDRILSSAQWKEFAVRHLNEPIANNQAIRNYLNNNASIQSLVLRDNVDKFNMTYFDLLTHIASKDNSGTYFSQGVQDALIKFQKVLPQMHQVLSETVAGNILSAISPGAFSVTSPGSGINRPVFVQQLHARNMALEQMPLEYLNRIGANAGALTITPQMALWKELDDIVLPDGTLHKDQISSITTAFKQISDEQLQSRYDTVGKNIKKLAKANGLDANLLQDAFNITRQTMPSVYEGSLIMSSSLATAYHDATTDTKKLTFDRIQRIKDEEYLGYTREKLQSLAGQKVDRNTIIGYDKGGAIYWDGLDTILTERNIKEILDDGVTTITPTNTISSRKFMLGGSEKAIAGGVIVNDEFLARTGFQSKDEAFKYLDFVFEEVLGVRGGEYIPALAGNLGTAKHISGLHLQSSLNLIVNEYRKAGQLDALVSSMQSNGYKHWNLETMDNMLFADTLDSNFVYDMTRLLDDIHGNRIGVESVNSALSGILKTFEDTGLAYLDLQSNVQNQIMGEHLRMDPRVEAAIRRRNKAEYYLTGNDDRYTINGKRFEDIMMDELRRDTLSGANDYIHAKDLGGGAYAELMEEISKDQNASLIKHRRKLQSQEKVVAGISEAVQYLNNPDMDISNRNIVTVTMDELLTRAPEPTRENLSHFIYKPNGQFSDEFIKMANAKGVDLSTDTFTVAVDLGREIRLDDKTKVSKLLVPLYDVYDDFSDAASEENVHFTKSLGAFQSLMRTYRDNIGKSSATAEKALAQSIAQLSLAWAEELTTDDKTALGFKTFGKFILPNSTYLLGQDEIAPVTKEMFGLRAQEESIEELIRSGDISAEKLQELIDARTLRTNKLKAIANSDLELAGNELYRGYTKAKNGGFLNVNAVNRNTFETRLGFDIGLFGKTLYEDIVNGTDLHYMEIGQRKFSITRANIGDYEAEIYKNIMENVRHDEIQFGFTGNLSHDIDQYIVSIRDLNEQIVDNAKRIKANEALRDNVKVINSAFDIIGSKYLQEIGITTELTVRHPAFAMGIGPANLILDNTVGDEQLRVLGPLYSALMNLDHDGDTMGIAVRNAAQAMRKDKAGVAAAMRAIEEYASTDIDILREKIESGEAYKADRISDLRYNEVQTLKSYDADTYKKVKSDVVASLGIDRNKMIEEVSSSLSGEYTSSVKRIQRATDIVDESIDYLVTYSDPMNKAIETYNRANGNSLKSEAARIAAMKAKVNKENIGMISNASFSLHDAVSVAFSKADDSKKRHLASLYVHMDYLGEEGMNGLMTLAEQKGIDTKHIIDATNITNTPLFSKGMRTIMSKKRKQDTVERGLVNIMQSLNNIMFKGKANDELYIIAKEIMNTSMDEYTRLIDTATDVDVAKDLISKRQLRALYELSNEDVIRTAFNSPLRRVYKSGQGYSDFKGFMQGIVDINDYMSENNMASKMFGTYSASSDVKLGFMPDTLYVSDGGLGQSKGYVLKPHNASKGQILRKKGNQHVLEFTEVDFTDSLPKTGNTVTFVGKNNREIMEKANQYFAKNSDGLISISTRAFKENTDRTKIDGFFENKRQAKTVSILNRFYSDGTDFHMQDFHALGKAKRDALHQEIGKVNFDLLQKFSTTTQEELKELDRLHSFMATRNEKVKAMSHEALIREINADIVANPDKYGNETSFLSYGDIVRAKYRDMVGADEFARHEKVFSTLGENFDYSGYNKILDLLRDNTYDIMSERHQLEANIKDLEQYRQYNIPKINTTLDESSTVIAEHIRALTKEQNKRIHATEKTIYGLFDSSKQIDTFFNWDSLNRANVVGFGEYIGYSFEQLSQGDIDKILQYADKYQSFYTQDKGSMQEYAYTKTKALLTEWNKTKGTAKTSARTYAMSKATREKLTEISQLADAGSFRQTMEDIAKNYKQAQNSAKETVSKRTLRNSVFTNAKEALNKIPAKTIVGVIGAGAAIGIVNNLLHNQKNQSPLTPARNSGVSDTPSTQSPAQQAPMSTKRTVYHDSGSGFNFKVSAQTKNYINDKNNAKLISMSGGGNSSIYSQADMSGVTDNWLENKFAELV